MNKQHWTWQYGKLAEAVKVLACHPGVVKARVWAAAESIGALHVEAIPLSCKDDLAWIKKALTRYPPTEYEKSAQEATYRRTRNATAEKIAQRIWRMYGRFREEMYTRTPDR